MRTQLHPMIRTDGFPGGSMFEPARLAAAWANYRRRGAVFHGDAAEHAAFLRELEHISKKFYEVKYADLKGRQFVPASDEGTSPGDQSFTWRMWEKKGEARPIADYSEDLPLVNVHGEESTQRLQPYGIAFGYSQEEIAAAAKFGRPLESDRATTAKRISDENLDKIAAIGDPNRGLRGLLTLQNTVTATPATKGAGGTAWLTSDRTALAATPDEVIADVSAAVTAIRSASRDRERPTRILMPVEHYTLIKSKPRSAVSDTSILSFLEGVFDDIEFVSWEYLKNGAYDPASPSSTPTTDRLVAYDPKPEQLKLLMPLEFTMLPPEPRNLAFRVNCWWKSGGVIAHYPKSICFMDAI